MTKKIDPVADTPANTIAFLEFMVGGLYEACGPANDDIYDSIRQDWIGLGHVVPTAFMGHEE